MDKTNSDTEAIEKNGFCWYYLKLKTSPYIKKYQVLVTAIHWRWGDFNTFYLTIFCLFFRLTRIPRFRLMCFDELSSFIKKTFFI